VISFVNLNHDEYADRAAGKFEPEFSDTFLVNEFVGQALLYLEVSDVLRDHACEDEERFVHPKVYVTACQ
jgi:hypothetical protein